MLAASVLHCWGDIGASLDRDGGIIRESDVKEKRLKYFGRSSPLRPRHLKHRGSGQVRIIHSKYGTRKKVEIEESFSRPCSSTVNLCSLAHFSGSFSIPLLILQAHPKTAPVSGWYSLCTCTVHVGAILWWWWCSLKAKPLQPQRPHGAWISPSGNRTTVEGVVWPGAQRIQTRDHTARPGSRPG